MRYCLCELPSRSHLSAPSIVRGCVVTAANDSSKVVVRVRLPPPAPEAATRSTVGTPPASRRRVRARLILFVLPLLAIALLFVFRPQDLRVLAPSPSPSLSPSPTSSASATTDLSAVPSECRGDVKGLAFASGSLDDRIRAANAWGAAHRGDTASVVVTNDVMRDAASKQQWSVPVEDIGVTIEPAGFRMSATANIFGRYTIRALLVPRAVDGTLRVTTQDLDTDGLPGFFRGSV